MFSSTFASFYHNFIVGRHLSYLEDAEGLGIFLQYSVVSSVWH